MMVFYPILWGLICSFIFVPGHSVVLGNCTLFFHSDGWLLHTRILSCGVYAFFQVLIEIDLSNLWLCPGLRIGPQLMDGLSAGRSPPRRQRQRQCHEHHNRQPTHNSWPRYSCLQSCLLLHQLWGVVQSLTSVAAKPLVNAFISNRLDYCNSLLYGITDNQLQHLHSVSNAAVRLVTGTRRSEHITRCWGHSTGRQVASVSRSRSPQLFTNVYTAVLQCTCPTTYTPDRHALCQRGPTARGPRPSTAIGDRSFRIDGPRVWNTACFCSWHKLVLELQKTPENVSLCLTATAVVALNWRL